MLFRSKVNGYHDRAIKLLKEHDRIPFGQPNIIGRGDIYKKVNGYHDREIGRASCRERV